jgi:hemolysin activation/secretion protein
MMLLGYSLLCAISVFEEMPSAQTVVAVQEKSAEPSLQGDVTEAKIGTVRFYNQNWVSKERIDQSLQIKEGDTLNLDTMLNRVAWFNRNPFHYSEVIMSPGKKPGETNIEVVTKDRYPIRPYVGADNTGIRYTGNARLYAGITFGNAFWIDDQLTYQFTSSADAKKFISNFINYVSYLPWMHQFQVYGGYTKIRPHIMNFHSNGENGQASLRYIIPFKPLYKQLVHQIIVGFDYKFLNTSLFFVGDNFHAPVMKQASNLTEFSLGYNLSYKGGRQSTTFNWEVFGSPFTWLPHQTPKAYNNISRNSRPKFFYTRLSLGYQVRIPLDFTISTLLRGQWTTQPLLISEKFGLGGYDTVRGYDERLLNMDTAICANLELRAPSIHLIRKWKDDLIFLGFVDYGFGHNFRPLMHKISTQYLFSAGPGVRWNILPYLTLRADYGFRLHQVFGKHHLGKFHGGISLSY